MTNGARISVVELVGTTPVLAPAHGLRSKALAEALEMVLDDRDLVLLGSDTVRAAPGNGSARNQHSVFATA